MPKKETGTAVTSWREEMAAQAKRAQEIEKNEGGGRFFSMRAGQLKFDDVAMPGNMMACIIVGVAHENVWYQEKYDPDNKTPPTCFAFWKDTMDHDLDEMSPPAIVDEEEVFERQSDYCKTCWANEWGSAETGKGKACSNRRRLAIIPAGVYKSQGKNKGFDLEMFEDEADFKKSDLAYLKLPVMSVKAYSAYVREVSEQLGKPLWAVFTNVAVEPDDRSQFKVTFELIDEVPEELMEVIYKRHKEAMDEVDFNYRPPSEEDEKEAKQTATKNTAAKKLSGGAAAKGRQKTKK